MSVVGRGRPGGSVRDNSLVIAASRARVGLRRAWWRGTGAFPAQVGKKKSLMDDYVSFMKIHYIWIKISGTTETARLSKK